MAETLIATKCDNCDEPRWSNQVVIQEDGSKLCAGCERDRQGEVNEVFVKSTEVWSGDHEIGSADFTWPRKADDPIQGDVHIKVEPPPDLLIFASGSVRTVEANSEDAYRQWEIRFIPTLAGRDVSELLKNGRQGQDWWLAKRLAYYAVTGYYPDLTPPFPTAPHGGRVPASIG